MVWMSASKLTTVVNSNSDFLNFGQVQQRRASRIPARGTLQQHILPREVSRYRKNEFLRYLLNLLFKPRVSWNFCFSVKKITCIKTKLSDRAKLSRENTQQTDVFPLPSLRPPLIFPLHDRATVFFKQHSLQYRRQESKLQRYPIDFESPIRGAI